MRKTVLGMFICLCSLSAQSQIALSDSASHIMATAYAGTLAGPKVAVKDGATQAFYTLRAGGTIAWEPMKWIAVFGVAGGELAQTDTVTPIGIFGIKVRPCKTVSLTFGKVASPVAELRPVPISAAAQFEPWTLARLPGSALGGKIAFAPAKDLSFVAGEFWRGTEASMEFGMTYRHASFAGYYMTQSHLYGSAVDLTYKSLRVVVEYTHEKSAGMFAVYGIPRTHGLSLYSDIGFHPVTQKMLRGEWGFMQSAHSGPLKLLIALGYAEETQCVKGYIFVHL